jgi:1-acyl-sn-glycerol-3-phosphate acyltransferase
MRTRFSFTALRTLELLIWPLRRITLHQALIAGLPPALPDDLPLLIVANHVSWWDGFVLRDTHERIRPRAPIFTLMSEAGLRRRPWLRWLGAVGIDTDPCRRPASVLHAFRLLRRMRDANGASVFFIFPQGRIWPSSRRPLGFRPGVSVLTAILAPVIVLPLGIHVEPLNRRRSTVFISAGGPLGMDRGRPDFRSLEQAVEIELDAIRTFLDVHGEDSPARWPGVYDPLPSPDRPITAAPTRGPDEAIPYSIVAAASTGQHG